jgi:hypothetical protein
MLPAGKHKPHREITFDLAGDETNIAYSDGVTPAFVYTYDRLGRQSSMAWNGITDPFTINESVHPCEFVVDFIRTDCRPIAIPSL